MNKTHKMIFIKSVNEGLYKTTDFAKATDQLVILSQFLENDINDSPKFPVEWLLSEDDEIDLHVSTLKKKSNQMIELNHQYIDNLEPVIMSIPKLIELIQKWVELVNKKTKVFSLTQNGDEFTLEEIETKKFDVNR